MRVWWVGSDVWDKVTNKSVFFTPSLIRRHIIIKQEGDKNEEELKKGHDIIYYMANMKQDEL